MTSRWMQSAHELTTMISTYNVENEMLREAEADVGSFIFLSRNFISSRNWSIFPLWEGDFRILNIEDGKKLYLADALQSYFLKNESKFARACYINSGNWLANPKFGSLSIAIQELDLIKDYVGNIFEQTEDHIPFYGPGFIWTEKMECVVFTDSDQVSFIAGNGAEIQSLLGLSWDYCRDIYKLYQSTEAWSKYLAPMLNFAIDFSYLSRSK